MAYDEDLAHRIRASLAAATADGGATVPAIVTEQRMFGGLGFMVGGHMAVAIYERLRNWVRNLRGLADGPPVDYMKLLPLTYVAVVVGGAYMLLTLTADIVNPIKLNL